MTPRSHAYAVLNALHHARTITQKAEAHAGRMYGWGSEEHREARDEAQRIAAEYAEALYTFNNRGH